MSALPDRRKQLIRLVHVAKRDLRLDDENYRAILLRETKKHSCSLMSEPELDKVLKALRRNGFNVKHSRPAPSDARRPIRLRDGQAALITALWLNLWHLAVVRSNDDKAIDAFCARQIRVEKMQWLTPAKANKVIEALKDWSAREGFVVPHVPHEAEPGLTAKRALCDAIFARLDDDGRRDFADDMLYVHTLTAHDASRLANAMGYRLRELMKERAE